MLKQLVVLSGKGGTGKTVVSAALVHLAAAGNGRSRPAVSVDADVDAANLELLIGRRLGEAHEFLGMPVAQVATEDCFGCGMCLEVCRFGAVRLAEDGWTYAVDQHACEGCASCLHQCPREAISMVPRLAGYWYRSESYVATPFFHARLRPAQENSGKLVTLIREQARKSALEGGYPLVIVDGPPGIACPAIASSAGADLALLVAEPTAAGMHDLERALAMTAHFRLRSAVCVNKSDLHPEGARAIRAGCRNLGVEVLGSIPFDDAVVQATMAGRPVTEVLPQSAASRQLIRLWHDVGALLREAA